MKTVVWITWWMMVLITAALAVVLIFNFSVANLLKVIWCVVLTGMTRAMIGTIYGGEG